MARVTCGDTEPQLFAVRDSLKLIISCRSRNVPALTNSLGSGPFSKILLAIYFILTAVIGELEAAGLVAMPKLVWAGLRNRHRQLINGFQ